mmetsp:Transcript_3378/g.7993  ORF Transcript_3378/g.7993 Transcript_3378/m.7993 type:complete len:217 (+) Transcript_3378:3566-4216(+)
MLSGRLLKPGRGILWVCDSIARHDPACMGQRHRDARSRERHLVVPDGFLRALVGCDGSGGGARRIRRPRRERLCGRDCHGMEHGIGRAAPRRGRTHRAGALPVNCNQRETQSTGHAPRGRAACSQLWGGRLRRAVGPVDGVPGGAVLCRRAAPCGRPECPRDELGLGGGGRRRRPREAALPAAPSPVRHLTSVAPSNCRRCSRRGGQSSAPVPESC